MKEPKTQSRGASRLWWTIVTVSILCVVAWRLMNRSSTPEIDLEPISIEWMGSYEAQTLCQSRVKSGKKVYATVQRGGRLEALHVAPGDKVEVGQVLGVVDQTIRTAQLKSALSQYQLAQRDFRRMEKLKGSGASSQEEYDRSQSNLEVKRAFLEEVRQEVEDSMLRATVSGTISTVVFQPGDKVADGSRVIAIENQSLAQVFCRIPSREAARLKLGTQQVEWRWTEQDQRTVSKRSVQVLSQIEAPSMGDYQGIDRLIKVQSEAAELSAAIGILVTLPLPLKAVDQSARIPTHSVVKRQGGFYVLARPVSGPWQWRPVQVLYRDDQSAVVAPMDEQLQVAKIDRDVQRIESIVERMKLSSEAKL